MGRARQDTGGEKRLEGGSFFGAIQRKQEVSGAIFTDLYHAQTRRLPAHSHELPFFALLLDGDYRETYCHHQRDFGPFDVSFRPAGVPHQDMVGPRGVRFFEIEIRPVWQKRLQEYPFGLQRAHDDCYGGPLLWLGMKLFCETRQPVERESLQIESLLAELLGQVASMPGEKTKEAPSWMRRIVDKLKAEFCERLTLDQLSREAGVHPVHLSRVFRELLGEGIGEYTHRLRVHSACRQMLAPEARLAEISVAAGFADQSHFHRTFRKLTGMSPGRFRQLMT